MAESEAGDAIHIVMELCSGGSLQKQFENGPMSIQEVSRAIHDVCLGLDALHGRNMLHRDIKPGNLLRAGSRTKLGDFGLVTDEIILGYAKAAGYADHIAHEVWHGHGTSVRSDIWGLGITIYRLLSGKDWYSRFPRLQIAARKGGLASSLQWLPHVPKKLRRIIRRMLNDDTKARFQSVGQVMSALAKLPRVPDFNCEIEPDEITWTRVTPPRRTNVVWKRTGKTSYEWEAWSEPIKIGTGNRRSLGGSASPTSHSQSLKQLDAFFASQR